MRNLVKNTIGFAERLLEQVLAEEAYQYAPKKAKQQSKALPRNYIVFSSANHGPVVGSIKKTIIDDTVYESSLITCTTHVVDSYTGAGEQGLIVNDQNVVQRGTK